MNKIIALIIIIIFPLTILNVYSAPTEYDSEQDDIIDNNIDNISDNTDDIGDIVDNGIDNIENILSNKTDIAINASSINSLDQQLYNTTANTIYNSQRLDELEETQIIIGLKGRIYDSKKWQINIFADYSTNRNKVDRTGIRFTYKFGSSFEERKIEELEKKLNKLIKEERND